MIRRSLALIATLAALAMLLGACGDADEDLDPTEAPRNTATPEPTATVTIDASRAGAQDAPPTKGFDELQQWDAPPAMMLEDGVDYRARIITNFGDVTVDLFEGEAPNTVNNFVFLANQGFYENVPIHRVLAGFVIQSGDPTGTGTGGPGYRFADEPVVRDYTRGTLAMANAGPNTNGSQFFITLADLSGQLPKNYTIFGEVVEGLDVVDQIAQVPVQRGPSGEASSPTEPVFIESIEIITN